MRTHIELSIYENLISKATLRDAILISNNRQLSTFYVRTYTRKLPYTTTTTYLSRQQQQQHKRKIIDPWCYALMHRRVFHSNATV